MRVFGASGCPETADAQVVDLRLPNRAPREAGSRIATRCASSARPVASETEDAQRRRFKTYARGLHALRRRCREGQRSRISRDTLLGRLTLPPQPPPRIRSGKLLMPNPAADP